MVRCYAQWKKSAKKDEKRSLPSQRLLSYRLIIVLLCRLHRTSSRWPPRQTGLNNLAIDLEQMTVFRPDTSLGGS